MTIAVDWDIRNQTKQNLVPFAGHPLNFVSDNNGLQLLFVFFSSGDIENLRNIYTGNYILYFDKNKGKSNHQVMVFPETGLPDSQKPVWDPRVKKSVHPLGPQKKTNHNYLN